MYSIDDKLRQVRFELAGPLIEHLCKLYDKSSSKHFFDGAKSYDIGEYIIQTEGFFIYSHSKNIYIRYDIPKHIMYNGENILNTFSNSKINRYTVMEFPNGLTVDQINEHLIKLHMGL